jgi:hypothetical protein
MPDEAVDWVALAGDTPTDPAWLEDAFALLRIPSVSASEDHAADVLRCAEWLRANTSPAAATPSSYQPSANHSSWRCVPRSTRSC